MHTQCAVRLILELPYSFPASISSWSTCVFAKGMYLAKGMCLATELLRRLCCWLQLDNFADDAAMRRLGNGAKFYGKRRSSFYGKDDADRA